MTGTPLAQTSLHLWGLVSVAYIVLAIWAVRRALRSPAEAERDGVNKTMSDRIRLYRLGLVCCVFGAVGAVISAAVAKEVGYPVPRHFLLLTVLGATYTFCFFLWLLKRLKRSN